MAGPDSPPEKSTGDEEFWEVPRHVPFARELDSLGVDGSWLDPLRAALDADHQAAAEARVRQLVERAHPALEARRHLVDLWALHTAIAKNDAPTDRLIIHRYEQGESIPEPALRQGAISQREEERLNKEIEEAQREWERLQNEHSEVLERLGYWIDVLKSNREKAKRIAGQGATHEPGRPSSGTESEG